MRDPHCAAWCWLKGFEGQQRLWGGMRGFLCEETMSLLEQVAILHEPLRHDRHRWCCRQVKTPVPGVSRALSVEWSE